MIFKNAHIYRLTQSLDITGEQLDDFLGESAFTPFRGIRPSSFGWVPPIAQGVFVPEDSGCSLLCANREDKVLPTSALADILNEQIETLE